MSLPPCTSRHRSPITWVKGGGQPAPEGPHRVPTALHPEASPPAAVRAWAPSGSSDVSRQNKTSWPVTLVGAAKASKTVGMSGQETDPDLAITTGGHRPQGYGDLESRSGAGSAPAHPAWQPGDIPAPPGRGSWPAPPSRCRLCFLSSLLPLWLTPTLFSLHRNRHNTEWTSSLAYGQL